MSIFSTTFLAEAATRTLSLPKNPSITVQEDIWPSLPAPLQYQNRYYRSDSALLATHNESLWDTNLVARDNAELSIAKARQKGMPVIGLLYPSEASLAFLNGKGDPSHQLVNGLQPEETFLFAGDFHLIQFQVDDLYMTGGALTRCFCQSLRSVLAHSKVQRIHFILPAMHGALPEYWKLRGLELPLGSYAEAQPSEGFGETPRVYSDVERNILDRNLAEALAPLSDADLKQFVQFGLFGNSSRGIPYCDGRKFLEQEARSYTIQLYRGTQYLGSFGNGSEKLDLILEFK